MKNKFWFDECYSLNEYYAQCKSYNIRVDSIVRTSMFNSRGLMEKNYCEKVHDIMYNVYQTIRAYDKVVQDYSNGKVNRRDVEEIENIVFAIKLIDDFKLWNSFYKYSEGYGKFYCDDEETKLYHLIINKIQTYDIKSILDFGVGNGKIWKKFAPILPNVKIYLVEKNLYFISILQKCFINQKNVRICDSLKSFYNFIKKVDLVLSSDTIEHLRHPNYYLDFLHSIYNKGLFIKIGIGEANAHMPPIYSDTEIHGKLAEYKQNGFLIDTLSLLGSNIVNNCKFFTLQ